MLPSFPKAHKRLNDEWQKRMFAAKAAVLPPHIHPPIHNIIEGKSSDFQRDDGLIKPTAMKLNQVKSTISIADGKGMTLAAFDENARYMGTALGKQIWEGILQAVNEAVAETGSEIKVKNSTITKEDFLRIIDMTTYNFDGAGNPTNMFIVSPEMAEGFKKAEAEWKSDQEFVAKVEAIKRKKKEEFDEREACRRLVD